MEKSASTVTVKVEPSQEDHGGAAQVGSLPTVSGGSTAVLPPQQGAWLPANRFAVVLPEISPAPASITISIGDHASEAKAAGSKTDKAKAKRRSVVRMCPCGGAGGDPREMDMDMDGVSRIVVVLVFHSNAVDGIVVAYERDGQVPERTPLWGGTSGGSSGFDLEPGEYLTSLQGHYSEFKGKLVVRSLKFISNLRTHGPYGKEDGVPFALPAPAGGKIIGFHARSDDQYLHAIGTYVKMDN